MVFVSKGINELTFDLNFFTPKNLPTKDKWAYGDWDSKIEPSLTALTPYSDLFPIEKLRCLGIPHARNLFVIPYPFISQVKHLLSPEHFSTYHTFAAYKFWVKDVNNVAFTENNIAYVSFNLYEFEYIKTYTTHSIMGPLTFAIGNPRFPYIVFNILPLSKDLHALEVSLYPNHTSGYRKYYFSKLWQVFFGFIKIGISEDDLFYKNNSHAEDTLFIIPTNSSTRTATKELHKGYRSLFSPRDITNISSYIT